MVIQEQLYRHRNSYVCYTGTALSAKGTIIFIVLYRNSFISQRNDYIGSTGTASLYRNSCASYRSNYIGPTGTAPSAKGNVIFPVADTAVPVQPMQLLL